METQGTWPRGPRSAYEDLRRAVMHRLRELGFRTTGGVARLEGEGACGVIEFQKSGRSTPEATTFTVNVGIALGALLPSGSKKPLAHCSAEECHARLGIGSLREGGGEVWWTLAADRPDAAVAGEVMERVEREAVPFVQRYAAGGVLAARWEAGDRLGVTEAQRVSHLRRLRPSPPGGNAG